MNKFELEKDCLRKVDEVELFDYKTNKPLYPLDADGLRLAKDDCIEFIKNAEYELGDKAVYIEKVENQRNLKELQLYMLYSIYKGYDIKVNANKRAKLATIYKYA